MGSRCFRACWLATTVASVACGGEVDLAGADGTSVSAQDAGSDIFAQPFDAPESDAADDFPDAAPLCGAGLAWCAGVCVDTSADSLNCGACGKQCAGACISGKCELCSGVPGLPGPPDIIAEKAPDSVVLGDLDGDGNLDVIAANADSDDVSVAMNRGDGTFAKAVAFPAGDIPFGVATADFDGDGALDIAVADRGASQHSGRLSVLRGLGDGTFLAPVTYKAGDFPWAITVSDVDRDGRPDIAVANDGSGDVSVFRNLGDGTFAPHVQYHAGVNPIDLVAADMDGDGYPDLATANVGTGAGDGDVSLLLNDGTGTFGEAIAYAAAAEPKSVAALDIDADGQEDLAVGGEGAEVALLVNAGHGVLVKQGDFAVDSGVQSMVAADMDADGLQDLVVGGVAGVSVLVNAGDGTFYGTTYPLEFLVSDVAVGDVNGDDVADVIAANLFAGTVSVLHGAGHGALAAPTACATGVCPRGLVAADLDGDGDADLAAVDSIGDRVAVLRNDGGGGVSELALYDVGPEPTAIAAADMNADGDDDLIVACDGELTVLLNTGDATFGPGAAYPVESKASAVAAGDLDGDGMADVVVGYRSKPSGPSSGLPPGPPPATKILSVLINNGDGTLAPAASYPTGDDPASVLIADVDGDGARDIVAANYWSSSISVLLNEGGAAFAPGSSYSAGSLPFAVAAGDMDGDGDLDLVVTNAASGGGSKGAILVLMNDGAGGFAATSTYLVRRGVAPVVVGDLDGDGAPDVIVMSTDDQNLLVLLNRGDGVLDDALAYPPFAPPRSLAIADFDGDGRLDLATGGCATVNSGGLVSLLLNRDVCGSR